MASLRELLLDRCSSSANAIGVAADAELLAEKHAQGPAVAAMYVALSIRVYVGRPLIVEGRVDAVDKRLSSTHLADSSNAQTSLFPPVQVLLEGRGSDMGLILSFIAQGKPYPSELVASLCRVCSEPFNYISSVTRAGDGWELTARCFPVRQGRGGAAIWWSDPNDQPAFYPLGAQFSLSRGKFHPAVEFCIWPTQPGRRPLCAVGPYQIFHGANETVSQLFMMRVANALTRGIVQSNYESSKLLRCIELEVAETKGIVSVCAPAWCVYNKTANRIFKLI
ncbi:MAG: hypothetical protein HUU55_01080 [Myxococcales bacterium]|nr:hypothetical protein [Myxococcales bacterium]